MVDQRLAQHITEKFEEHREKYANRILPTLEDPDEVWVSLYDDGGYRTLHLKRWRERERNALAVAVEGPDARLFWTFVPMTRNSYPDGQSAGARVWPRPEGG